MKEGTLSDDDLQTLSDSIGESWMKLGRRLKIVDAKLDDIKERWPTFAEKAYRMLKCWEEKDGSAANYRILSEALCSDYVSRTDLAEKICKS